LSTAARWRSWPATTRWRRPIQHGKGKASGIEVDDRYFMLYTFRGDKVVRIELVRDKTDALEAAGLTE
jgi:hypothetical protein